MLCENCHENEAVVSVVRVVNGEERTYSLCRECAAKAAGRSITIMPVHAGSFLGNILASVLGFSNEDDTEDEDIRPEQDLKKTNIVCPSCGMTYDEFLKFGKFGCQQCYATFNFLLDGYLKKIQGNCEHTGRHPLYNTATVSVPDISAELDTGFSTENDSGEDGGIAITVDRDSTVDELRAALRRAVSREEFEDAARIRDMIKECTGEKRHE